jgi:hypothetical protein
LNYWWCRGSNKLNFLKIHLLRQTTCQILHKYSCTYPDNKTWNEDYYYFHFSDEEAEVFKKVNCFPKAMLPVKDKIKLQTKAVWLHPKPLTAIIFCPWQERSYFFPFNGLTSIFQPWVQDPPRHSNISKESPQILWNFVLSPQFK